MEITSEKTDTVDFFPRIEMIEGFFFNRIEGCGAYNSRIGEYKLGFFIFTNTADTETPALYDTTVGA